MKRENGSMKRWVVASHLLMLIAASAARAQNGACCLPDELCEETTGGECADLAGAFQGDGTACASHCPSRLSSAITYQGQLQREGSPYSGPAQMQFTLWNLPVGGQPVANPIVMDSVEVVNGLFRVQLDFGADAIRGSARWLEVEVCTQACIEPGAFTVLQPRHALSAVPFALQTRGIVVDGAGNIGAGTDTPTAMIHLNRPFAETALRFQTIRFQEGPPLPSLRSPGTASASGPGQVWDNPDLARLSDDQRDSNNLFAGPGEPDPNVTQPLDLTNFGFTLPAGAQIVGVSVQIEGSATCTCSDCDRCVVNVRAELLGGDAASAQALVQLQATEATHAVGGTLERWGLEWTAEQVNAGGFGVRLVGELSLLETLICIPGLGCSYQTCDCTGSGDVFIDAVSVTLYFYAVAETSTLVDFSLGIPEDRALLQIAPTPDLSNPAVSVTRTGNVGIGTVDPLTFKLAVNGFAAKPGGGQWSMFSDFRLKRNIKPMEGTLERLLSLRGYEFDYLPQAVEKRFALPGRQFGLMAEEVEEVFPDWVAKDAEGYRYVTERGTTALLVEALRELRAEKDAQLAQRDGRIAELEERMRRVETTLEGK